MAGDDPYAQINVDDLPAPEKAADPYANLNVDAIPPPEKILPKVGEAISDFGKEAYRTADEISGGLLNKGVDTAKSIANDLSSASDAAGLTGALDTTFGIAKDVVKAPFEVMAPVFDVSDRAMGTLVGNSIDGYQSMFGAKGSFMTKMKLQDMQNQANLANWQNDRTTKLPEPRTLPVSLFKDIFADPVSKSIQSIGKNLQESSSTPVKALGEVAEGLAPGMGLAAGLAGSWYMDPISITRVGKLTELGEELAKTSGLAPASGLAPGWAKQIAAGQRSLLGAEFSAPFAESKFINLTPAKTSGAFVDKLQEAAVKFDSSRLGQQFGKITTLPPFENIGQMGQNFVYEKNINQAESKALREMSESKFNSLGLDYSNPEQRADFAKYVENPGAYKPQLADPKVYESVYQDLNGKLQGAVNEARANGIDIPDKYAMLGPRQANESERYIPRFADYGKQQLKQASRVFQDEELAGAKAEQAVADIGLANNGSGKGISTSFLKERSLLNRDSMNKLIEERYGVKDYFHDDVIQAYSDKIQNIRDATAAKKLADGVLQTSGRSELEWAKIRFAARDRVELARTQGVLPDPIDVRLMHVDPKSLVKVDDKVTSMFGQVAGEKARGLLLPKADADFINGLFTAPKQNEVQRYINSYMKAWKGAVFFNPGFIGRNAWENFTRAYGLGVTQPELALGHAGYVFNKGKYAKYYDEFNNAEKMLGMASDAEKSSSAEKIIAPLGAKEIENGLDRTHRGLYEMAARGTVGKWFDNSRKVFDSVSNNPLYRFAKSANNEWENSFRFSYYSKLREMGYDKLAALKEVDKNFISYNIVRNTVSQNQAYIPFLNFMAKNAETAVNLFQKSPKGAVMFAPGGALERAIENWSGWDPNSVKRFKEIHGQYYTDDILGPILPGKDAMEKEKDYTKRMLNAWMNPDGNMTGYQLWAKLPSSFSGLLSYDPTKMNSMAGPMVKLGLMLGLGIDPQTGQKFAAADNEFSGATERLLKAFDEVSGPFVPDRLINASRQVLANNWPNAEKSLSNFGFSPDVVKAVLGDKENDKLQDKMKKALLSMKSVYMGNATKVDVDIMIRQMAEMQQTKRDMSQLIKMKAKGGTDRELDKEINRGIRNIQKGADNLINFIDIKNDYDKRLIQMGAPPSPDIEYKDIQEDLTAPKAPPEAPEPTRDEAAQGVRDSAYKAILEDKQFAKNNPPMRNPAGSFGSQVQVMPNGEVKVSNSNMGNVDPGIWTNFVKDQMKKSGYKTLSPSQIKVFENHIKQEAEKQHNDYVRPNQPQRELASEVNE